MLAPRSQQSKALNKTEGITLETNNRLLPWYIGIVLVLAAVLFVGYRMWTTSCPAPMLIELGVLTVVPIVYLVLMYLTFVSQK
ncbi:hypothetical protein [Methyloceanibacter sp. wino2]|uniref:hypothetical protein n=1 Tax=Methyloceanibacter sp. wino2 TaxID=2170729 RepID=UPI000D3EB485|nr:hypothetical protein [Methyloceanibacter sp. wino2]